MKLIADTSVIIAVITSEHTKSQLLKLTSGYELYAPASIHWEIGNAISAMYKRKSISNQGGNFILSEYSKIPISTVGINIAEALRIAYSFNMYAYDAYMIQCAIEQKSELITLDKKLVEISKKMNIKTIEVN